MKKSDLINIIREELMIQEMSDVDLYIAEHNDFYKIRKDINQLAVKLKTKFGLKDNDTAIRDILNKLEDELL